MMTTERQALDQLLSQLEHPSEQELAAMVEETDRLIEIELERLANEWPHHWRVG